MRRVLRSAFCFPALAAAFFSFADPAFTEAGTTVNTALDRIADAVDGAESSHGRDLSMWRPNPAGPQGPMQVSERAAVDVGGGDRFEIAQNRALGRAYLSLLHRRYGNWADAVSAYNWGMGNLDRWIEAGRRSERLVPAVAVYLRRVLRDSGVCQLENCQTQMARINRKGRRFNDGEGTGNDNLLLPGMEQSGRPLPRLASSGRPLPIIGHRGRLLPGLEASGRPLPNLERSGRSL